MTSTSTTPITPVGSVGRGATTAEHRVRLRRAHLRLLEPGRNASIVDIARHRARRDGLARLHAYAATRALPPVFCAWSAALLHGLPVLHDPPEAIHVLASGRAETVSPGVIAHRRTEGPPGDVCERCGLRVTSVARTVADLAAATSFVGGAVLADAALSTGPFGERTALATRPLIRAAAENIPDPVGRRRALAVVGFADGRAESGLESVSSATMALAGAPPPRLQVPLRDDAGFRVRVDFLWPELGLAGEADGAAKTVHPAMLRGRSPAEAVARLDARRRAIEALGVRVMSWRWETGRRVDRMRALLHAHGIPLASGPAIEGL